VSSAAIVPISTVAQMCHEVNRAWCEINGDHSQVPWDQAEDWQRQSAFEGVKAALEGQTPEQLHESWCEMKIRDGWSYGTFKDAVKKTHPCLVPYSSLPVSQKHKGHLFRGTVKALRPEAFRDA
jgi:hypothetical protein